MRARLVVLLLALVASASAAEAVGWTLDEVPLSFDAVASSLTLACDPRPPQLSAMFLGYVGGLDAGERRLLDEQMADPLALLELDEVPTDLLGLLTVRRIGPIVGARVTDIPQEHALAVAALDGGPIPAEFLRSYDAFAEIRHEPREEAQADLAALLAGEHG